MFARRHLSRLCALALTVTQLSGIQQATAEEHPPPVTGFLNKQVEGSAGALPYVLYVPRGYDPQQHWPLIVFLHGAGERGNDGLVQSAVGLGAAIRKNPDRFPALVLMPQCPKDRYWDAAVLQGVEQAMAETRRDYAVDEKRIYLTGLSMGGYGTWTWGAEMHETFAALMPICGGGRPEDMGRLAGESKDGGFLPFEDRVKRLAKLPIFAFHGADDQVVLPERTREMVEKVNAAGGSVRYQEFENTAHNSWDQAYGSEEAIAWLFAQQRP